MVKNFLECSQYFSTMHMYMLHIVLKFQIPAFSTFRDMNFFLVQTDRKRCI